MIDMVSRKKKFYVVWIGRTPGVFTAWSDCEASVKGYKNSRYKSFTTREEAEKAFGEGPQGYWGSGDQLSRAKQNDARLTDAGEPIAESLCVDAAWNTVTKTMEYRGVWLPDRSEAFWRGPFENATGNIGEFLAIVDALRLLVRKGLRLPVYSDSMVAIGWVRRRAVRSTSMAEGRTSGEIDELVARALEWLRGGEYESPILKWETAAWGENPADFGRK